LVKLARPDLFHPRIVLASCRRLPEGDGDDAGLVGALRTRGLHARWLPWDDPETLRADLVILRATWDYTDRLEEFLEWTTRVRNLLNAPAVVRWNSDKRYLADLAAAGVPIVPSEFAAPGEPIRVPDADEIVVKPTVGAGSVGVHRFSDPDVAHAYAERLHAAGATALLQPYDPRVEDGETALVFIAGEQSHAFRKAAILPPAGARPELDETGSYAKERLGAADPDFELWDVGYAALRAAADHLGVGTSDLLYARVDVFGGADDPRLSELELIEPSLGWGQLDEATRALRERDFAVAVGDALERLGLGPLSHRRP